MSDKNELIITKYFPRKDERSTKVSMGKKILDFFQKSIEDNENGLSEDEKDGKKNKSSSQKKLKECYYFGNDHRFCKNLNKELRFFKKDSLEFNLTKVEFNSANVHKILPYLLSVPNDALLFLDFSGLTKEVLALVKAINFSYPLRNKIIIGLLDVLSNPFIISSCMSIGGKINHVKRPDLAGIIYHGLYLLDPETLVKPEYATCEDDSVTEVYSLSHFGYLKKDHVFCETDHPLSIGQEIKCHWSFHHLSHHEFKVNSLVSHDLYYNKKNGAQLEFYFSESNEGSGKKQFEIELEKLIKNERKISSPKLIKMTIIDPTYKFINSLTKFPDQYGHLIRYHDQLCMDDLEQIKRSSHIIAFRLLTKVPSHYVIEDEPEDQFIKSINEDTLINLVKVAKSSELNPYVYVYNCPSDTQFLKEQLGHERIRAFPGDINLERELLPLADLIKKEHTNKKESTNGQIFLSKEGPYSMGFIEERITLKKINEIFIEFNSDLSIPIGGTFQLKDPFSCYITVVEDHLKISSHQYLGIIHGLNESHLIGLRRYVYDRMGREHTEKERLEKEQFFELNKQAALARGLDFSENENEEYDEVKLKINKPNLPEKLVGKSSQVNLENMFEEQLRRFYGLKKFPCDVYIKLSKEKYVKIFNREDEVESSRLDQFIQKGVSTVYLTADDVILFMDSLHLDLLQKMNLASLSTKNKTIGHLVLFDNLISKYQHLGMSESYLQNLRKTVDSCVAFLYTRPSLRILMERSLQKNYYCAEHGLMICVIADAIVQHCGWGNQQVSEKLALAALIHDATLANPSLCEIEELTPDVKDNLTEEEIRLIQEHPQQAQEALREIAQYYVDVDKIVLEHHERPGGKGFPKGLNENEICPLACVFILGEVLTREIYFSSPLNFKEVKERINQRFDYGQFKTPLQGLNVFIDQCLDSTSS